MTLVFIICDAVLLLIGVILLIRLCRFVKSHEQETVEAHRHYLIGHIVAILCTSLATSIIGIVSHFI